MLTPPFPEWVSHYSGRKFGLPVRFQQIPRSFSRARQQIGAASIATPVDYPGWEMLFFAEQVACFLQLEKVAGQAGSREHTGCEGLGQRLDPGGQALSAGDRFRVNH